MKTEVERAYRARAWFSPGPTQPFDEEGRSAVYPLITMKTFSFFQLLTSTCNSGSTLTIFYLSLCIPWEKNTTKRKQLNNRGISEFPRIFCFFLCAWEEITCAQEPAWSRESWSSCRSSPERNWVLKDSVRYQPTCSSRLQCS